MTRQQVCGLALVPILGLLTAASVASALPAPSPVRALPTPGTGRVLSAPTQVLTSELFSFHSDSLLNLHHFLYRWGQVGPGADTDGMDRRIILRDADLQAYDDLSADERDVWDAAVAFYRNAMIERDLLFDDDLVELRDCIAYAGNYCDDLTETDDAAVRVLQRTMNVYRAHSWQRHNRVNREWVANLLPSVQRFENDIAPRLAGAYGGGWPDPWTRVDVMPYANRVGGYTTGRPHITVSSVDEGNTGYLGLELMFHEASHGDTLERPLRRLVNESFEAAGGRRPADLWHMTIFITAGEVTRSALEAAGEGDYTPYGELAGIWGRRPDNTKAEELLREHWLPALQAGSGYRAAMRRVAEAWLTGTARQAGTPWRSWAPRWISELTGEARLCSRPWIRPVCPKTNGELNP